MVVSLEEQLARVQNCEQLDALYAETLQAFQTVAFRTGCKLKLEEVWDKKASSTALQIMTNEWLPRCKVVKDTKCHGKIAQRDIHYERRKVEIESFAESKFYAEWSLEMLQETPHRTETEFYLSCVVQKQPLKRATAARAPDDEDEIVQEDTMGMKEAIAFWWQHIDPAARTKISDAELKLFFTTCFTNGHDELVE